MANAGFGPHPPRAYYRGAKAVTPHDSNALPDGPCRAIWVTATGNVSFITIDGDTLSLLAVAANVELPFMCGVIRSTGTTATVVALY